MGEEFKQTNKFIFQSSEGGGGEAMKEKGEFELEIRRVFPDLRASRAQRGSILGGF